MPAIHREHAVGWIQSFAHKHTEKLLLDTTMVQSFLALVHAHLNLERAHQLSFFPPPELVESIGQDTVSSNN